MNLKELLQTYKSIRIPRIQRDYAQGRKDNPTTAIRHILLDEIFSGKDVSLNMIFGESDSDNIFIPIDGQQRLTLLFLIHLYGLKTGKVTDNYGVSKLRYETRNSTNEFWEFITDTDWAIDPDGSVSSWCRNHNGFQWYWDLDPTVRSMLVVLDDIHEWALKNSATYPDLDQIDFECHDMSQSGLNETLYLKMNSRGRHLNSFEKIKSALDGLINAVSDTYDTSCFDNYNWGVEISPDNMSFKERWEYCMDREWINWFWNETTAAMDGSILKFILAYTYIFLLCRKDNIQNSPIDTYKNEIKDLIQNDSQKILDSNLKIIPQYYHITSAFSIYNAEEKRTEECPELRQEYIEGLARLITDIVSANRNFRSSWNESIDFRNPTLEYKTSILGILASIMFYRGKTLLGRDFNLWLRFCWNMVENKVSDYESSLPLFCSNCKNYYANGSTHILTWLSTKHSLHTGNEQFEEECYKSTLLSPLTLGISTPLTSSILSAESHILNKGRIRHLLTDENQQLHNDIIEKWTNFQTIFNEKGEPRDPVSFIGNYIKCADIKKALAYGEDSYWSFLNVTYSAIKDKFNDKDFDSVWPYLFKSPVNKTDLLQRDHNQIAELNIRKQLLIPGFIKAMIKHWEHTKPRLNWFHSSYYLYPSGSKADWNFILMDWYVDEENDWNRMAIQILNSLNNKQTICINEKKTAVLFIDPDSQFSYWIGKDIYFFYHGYEFVLDRDYNIHIVSDDELPKESVIGISTDDSFIEKIDQLLSFNTSEGAIQ